MSKGSSISPRCKVLYLEVIDESGDVQAQRPAVIEDRAILLETLGLDTHPVNLDTRGQHHTVRLQACHPGTEKITRQQNHIMLKPENSHALTLQILRLLSSKAQGRKVFAYFFVGQRVKIIQKKIFTDSCVNLIMIYSSCT